MEILVTEAAPSGLSFFPQFVIDDIFNFYFLVEPKSISSSSTPPRGPGNRTFPHFLR